MSRYPTTAKSPRKIALRFVLMIGVVSFFADFTYEGARGVTGPFLASLGATATIVGIVAGLGELAGYGLRLVSGRWSEQTGQFWPITIFGYVVQMAAVPTLALASTWQMAALLIITERIGKAIRNPPRDVMLSHAAKEIGYGWGFGIHEALDQFGALFGPLLVAGMLWLKGDYHRAFAVLLIPGLITLVLLLTARWIYPRPEDLEAKPPNMQAKNLPGIFWLYLVGAALVATGFADFPLIAYHFQKSAVMNAAWVPVLYSVAMAVSGVGSLVFGRLFDRVGFSILIPLTIVSLFFAPLVFWGNFSLALVGSAIWGLGMGVHESIIPAAVAGMVSIQRRPSAYGLFTGAYGIAWFLGSAFMGILYDYSVAGTVIFCIVMQLAALPIFFVVWKRLASKSACNESLSR